MSLEDYFNGVRAQAPVVGSKEDFNNPTYNSINPSTTRSLGEVASDTALSPLVGLGHVADGVSSFATGKPSDSITDWLSNYQSSKVRIQMQQEDAAYARQRALDEKNGASSFQRALHGAGHFFDAPLQNTGRGLGEFAPALAVGAATGGLGGAAVAGLTGASTANNEGLHEGLSGLDLAKHDALGGVTNAALMAAGPLGDITGSGVKAALENAPMSALKKAMATKGAKGAVEGAYGGALPATQAAIEGQDPATAFGEGIAPGIGLGALHGSVEGTKAGVSATAGKLNDATSSLRDRFSNKSEEPSNEEAQEPSQQSQDTSATDNNEPAQESPTIKPEEAVNPSTLTDPNYKLSPEFKNELYNALNNHIIYDEGETPHTPEEASSAVQHVEDIINGTKSNSDNLNKSASDILPENGKPLEKHDNIKNLPPELLNNFIKEFGNSTHDSNLDTLLKTVRESNLPDGEAKDIINKYSDIKNNDALHAHNNYGDALAHIANEITPEQIDKLDDNSKAILRDVGRNDRPEFQDSKYDPTLYSKDTLNKLEQAHNAHKQFIDELTHKINNMDISDKEKSKHLSDMTQSQVGDRNILPSAAKTFGDYQVALAHGNKEKATNILAHVRDTARSKINLANHVHEYAGENGNIKENNGFQDVQWLRPDHTSNVGSALQYGSGRSRFWTNKRKFVNNNVTPDFKKSLDNTANLHTEYANNLTELHNKHFGEGESPIPKVEGVPSRGTSRNNGHFSNGSGSETPQSEEHSPIRENTNSREAEDRKSSEPRTETTEPEDRSGNGGGSQRLQHVDIDAIKKVKDRRAALQSAIAHRNPIKYSSEAKNRIYQKLVGAEYVKNSDGIWYPKNRDKSDVGFTQRTPQKEVQSQTLENPASKSLNSEAEKLSDINGVSHIHEMPTPGNTLLKNLDVETSDRPLISNSVSKDTSKKVLDHVYTSLGSILSDLNTHLTNNPPNLEYLNNEANQVYKLLGKDNKSFDPHYSQALGLSILNHIFNHNISKNFGDDFNPNISVNTLINNAVENSIKILGIEPDDNAPRNSLRYPLGGLAASMIRSMESHGLLTVSHIKEDNKTLNVITDTKYNHEIPHDYIFNMSAINPKDVKAPFQYNEPIEYTYDPQLSKKHNEAIKSINQTPYQTSPAMVKLIHSMGNSFYKMFEPEVTGKLLGYEKIREAKATSRKLAANWLLDRLSHDDWKEGEKIFFRAGKQSTGRIGFDGNINPQDSKLLRACTTANHRELSRNHDLTDWNRSFAQALGYKVERNSFEDTQKRASELKSELKDISKDVYSLITNKPLKGAQERLSKYIRDNGIDEHGLMAIIEHSMLDNHETFQSHLQSASDGIANGPSTQLMQFSDLRNPQHLRNMERAGVYFKSNDDSLNGNKNQQSGIQKELYSSAVENMAPYTTNDAMRHILTECGFIDVKGNWVRNAVKQPLQQTSYLSSAFGVAHSFKKSVVKAALDLVDQGKLDKNTTFKTLGIYKDAQGNFLHSEVKQEDFFHKKAKDIQNGLETYYPSEIRKYGAVMNAAIFAITKYLKEFKQDNLKELGNTITNGEYKELNSLIYDKSPEFNNDFIKLHYLPEEMSYEGRKAQSVKMLLKDAKTGKDIPQYGYNPSEKYPRAYSKYGLPTKGGGVVFNITAADVTPLVHGLVTKGLEKTTPVHDGIYSSVDKGVEVANNLNKGWALTQHSNPISNILDRFHNLYHASNDAFKAGLEEDFKALGLKEFGVENTFESVHDTLNSLERELRLKQKVSSKYQKYIEQYSVGPGSRILDNPKGKIVEQSSPEEMARQFHKDYSNLDSKVSLRKPNLSENTDNKKSNFIQHTSIKQDNSMYKLSDYLDKIANSRSISGNVISNLLKANKDQLDKIDLHFANSTDEMNAIANKNIFTDKDKGGYTPSKNRIIIRGNDLNTLLHETTHVLLTSKIEALPEGSKLLRGLEHSMNEVLNMNVKSTSPAALDHAELVSAMKEYSDRPREQLNEFAARFLASDALIEEGNKHKSSPFKLFINKVSKLLFGKENLIKKGMISREALKNIGNVAFYNEGNASNIIADNTLKNRVFIRDKGLSEEYAKAEKARDYAASSAEALSALASLRNAGWDFNPAQAQLFHQVRSQIDADKTKASSYLVKLAPIASNLLKAKGADYLGDGNPTKNLLALLSSHPENFKDAKVKTWFSTKSGTQFATKFGTALNATDHNQIMKAINKAGDYQIYADRAIQDILTDNSNKAFQKVTGSKNKLSEFADKLAEDTSKLADKEGMPEFARQIYKSVTAVMDKEIPILDTIRSCRYALEKSRQAARNKLPISLQNLFKRGLSKDESLSLFKVAKTDIAAHDNWEDIIKNNNMSSIKLNPEAKKHADNLAYHLATDKPVHNLHPNADIIAHKFGGNRNDIDKYIGEKAYSLLDKKTKGHMKDIFSHDPDAVRSVFGYHQDLIKRNNNGKFASNDSKFNALKGYMPNEYQDATFHVVAVDRGSQEYKDLKALGYTVTGKYHHNGIEDSSKDTVIMSGYNSGNVTSNQGGMSRIRYSVGGYNHEAGTTGQFSLGQVKPTGSYKYEGNPLRPVFNADGEVKHYERQYDLGDKIRYNRNNDLFKSLGTYEGNLVEMGVRNVINNSLITKLNEMYHQDDDKSGYINVAQSNDPIIKQAYNALPPAFKQQARVITGKKDFLPCPRSLVEDTFGSKRASIGDFWTGNTRWSPKVQEKVRNIATAILGEKAYPRLMAAENMLQSGVGTANRMIAVGSIVIPLRNMSTDILQLMSSGINPAHIAKRGKQIADEIKVYNRAQTNIFDLKARMANRSLSNKEKQSYQRRIDIEKNSIKDLSIHKLIKAGVYSVVDDNIVSNRDASGLITPYIQKGMDMMPKSMVTVGNNLLATRESHLFRYVQSAVETTDFIARALTYEKAIKDGWEHQAALQKCMNAFVDYGRAKGRVRDYAESIGAAWFWNTKLRSMAIAGQMFRDNPLLSIIYNHIPVNTHIGFLNNLSTPLTDNIISQAMDGHISHSLGWGSLGSSWRLNPWLELIH